MDAKARSRRLNRREFVREASFPCPRSGGGGGGRRANTRRAVFPDAVIGKRAARINANRAGSMYSGTLELSTYRIASHVVAVGVEYDNDDASDTSDSCVSAFFVFFCSSRATAHATSAPSEPPSAFFLPVAVTATSLKTSAKHSRIADSISPSSTRRPRIFTCPSPRPTKTRPTPGTSLVISPVRNRRSSDPSAFKTTLNRASVSFGSPAYPRPTCGPPSHSSASDESFSLFSGSASSSGRRETRGERSRDDVSSTRASFAGSSPGGAA